MINFQLYPLCGTFDPGQEISLQIILPRVDDQNYPLQVILTIWKIFEPIFVQNSQLMDPDHSEDLILTWRPPRGSLGGFGVLVEITDANGSVLGSNMTAFDILQDWTEFPRYGFLCDFSPNRDDLEAVLTDLLRCHINGLQYYDWQYRHDQLLPPGEIYPDPLDRTLSLNVIRRFLDLSQKYGMKSMPYMAVYAASLDFWKKHLGWALYDLEGKPYQFEDFLGIMDPTAGSPWTAHILEECARVLSELPFDGIHIDQYGEPRQGVNASGEPVNLPVAFQDFIKQLKRDQPGKTIVFNAVKNWPIEALAVSLADFQYIEIWPPETSYQDLSRIIIQSRRLSGGKPVIIAAYISAENPANIRLTDAVTFAHGGARIELGEGNRLIADPYFPNHEPISEGLHEYLGNYYDFMVCYGELIGPAVKRNHDYQVSLPAGVRSTVCQRDGLLSICLINQTGLAEAQWDQVHDLPETQVNFDLTLPIPGEISGVWWGSPDQVDWRLRSLSWEEDSGTCKVKIPRLEVWGTLVIKYSEKGIPS